MEKVADKATFVESQYPTAQAATHGLDRQHISRPSVPAAYARRKANGYLGMNVGMFFGGSDVVFVPGNPPLWQVTITFQMYDVGPFTLGVMDVNAWTGEPLPLDDGEIHRIQERTNAIVSRCEPASATAG